MMIEQVQVIRGEQSSGSSEEQKARRSDNKYLFYIL
jgi:hypothetical protein